MKSKSSKDHRSSTTGYDERMKSCKILTRSEFETSIVAGELAQLVRSQPAGRVIVIALSGRLGAGKTSFARGFAKGLKVRSRILSPTFLIMRKYRVGSQALWHIDCYRVGAKDLKQLGVEALLANPKNILLIEWAERIQTLLPRNTIWIRFRHGKKTNERILSFSKTI